MSAGSDTSTRTGASFARPPRIRALERLTFIALSVGMTAAVGEATNAATAVRIAKPALGAWLAGHLFDLMTGGAACFGLLVGIRMARRFAGRAGSRPRAAWIALIAALVAFPPLCKLCAAAGRAGTDAVNAAIESWLVGRFAYNGGETAFKIYLAAAYFARTAFFAAIAGAGIFAIVAAALIAGGGGYSSEGS
jgi:hypothetical protein